MFNYFLKQKPSNVLAKRYFYIGFFKAQGTAVIVTKPAILAVKSVQPDSQEPVSSEKSHYFNPGLLHEQDSPWAKQGPECELQFCDQNYNIREKHLQVRFPI